MAWISIATLLKQKKLHAGLFTPSIIPAPTFEDDLSLHVKWAYEHIYSIPYHRTLEQFYNSLLTLSFLRPQLVARKNHGIMHVTRAAFNVNLFANLYRLAGNNEAKQLTDEDLK